MTASLLYSRLEVLPLACRRFIIFSFASILLLCCLVVSPVSAESSPTNLWEPSPLEQIPESVGASLTAADGSVYFGAFNGNYYRFSTDGALVWTLSDIGVVMNQAAVSTDRLFVGASRSGGGAVLALDEDGAIRWQVSTGSGVIASPVLDVGGSLVYVATYDGILLGLSAGDGSERWRFQLPEGEKVSATPALSLDGTTIYVHTNNHQVFALGTSQVSRAMLMSAGGAQSQSSPVLWRSDIRPVPAP